MGAARGLAACLDTRTSGHVWASARLFEATPFDRGDGPTKWVIVDDLQAQGITSVCAIVLKVRPHAHCKLSSGGEYPLG
jgi:hypothetical protein